MDFSVISENWRYLLWGAYPDQPIGGAALTLWISLLAIVVSSILGLIWGVGLALSRGVFSKILSAVLGFFRAIPVVMLIFWIYFLLPVAFGWDIPKITTVVCGLALITGSYLAHAVKSGIIAIAQGQWSAGLSLGLNTWKILRFIILPQVLRTMFPSFVNQWISLIKDTSLAYIVGVNELTFLATQVNNRTMVYPIEIFLFVAFIYFTLCFILDFLVNCVMRKKYALK